MSGLKKMKKVKCGSNKLRLLAGGYNRIHTLAHWQPKKHPRRRPSDGPYIGGPMYG